MLPSPVFEVTKRAVTLFHSPGGMPGPSSSTSTRARPSLPRTRTARRETVPCRSELSMMLAIASRRLTASPSTTTGCGGASNEMTISGSTVMGMAARKALRTTSVRSTGLNRTESER
ncbi:hypothetical protein D3C72_1706640 [compost metagenome]